ncbi:ABC transporter ATP-binding protein [Micromonospora sp. NPDC005324]|uniref:ABC transporter ATP-binding protein n=1 Tax=Micromonospora sp. NPDC005324 TaxID=3157033 RepID=UPI0033B358F3
MAARLTVHDVKLGYGGAAAVDGVTLEVPDRQITTIIGSNGCGKSTLLKGMARLLTPERGHIALDGRPIHITDTRSVARIVGLLPQGPTAPDGVTVADLVARGRAPHQRWWQQWSREDEQAVQAAIDATDLTALADTAVHRLSGGQRQRAWIAMALAQDTPILLLDEPTTYLNVSHQVDVLELVRELNQRGRTIVMVLHDLNQAARYADHIVAMASGRVVASGTPERVITPDVLSDVFTLDALVVECPATGRPLVVPTGLPGRQLLTIVHQ